MICPECGSELSNKVTICNECGTIIKNTRIVKLKDNKKSVNRLFIIITISIILITSLIWLLVFGSEKIKIYKRSKVISELCANQKYIENTSIADFIDDYKCNIFASYMYDTKGNTLKKSHYKRLISFNDHSIYPIIKKFTGVEIINRYDEMITDYKYYEYLDKTGNFYIIEQERYSELLEFALKEKNFKLWKTLIEANENSLNKRYWDDVKYYFGPSYKRGKYESFEFKNIKKYIDEQKDFVDKYFEYNNPTMICLFDKDLLKYCYNKDGNLDNNIIYAFSSYMNDIPLNELKKYIENGGYFYKKGDYFLDNILSNYIYILNEKNFENEDLEKIDFIFETAKKEGMDITYSNYLDKYLYYHSLTAMYNDEKVYSKIYYKLKNKGFKCYEHCSYEKYYK